MAVLRCNFSILAVVFLFIADVYTRTDNKRILLENEPTVDLGGELGKLQAQINERGSVYVRWGRTVCPTTASLVYKAGNYYHEDGSGSDNMCLPTNPTWSKYVDGVSDPWRAYIYGTEIDTGDTDHIFNYPINEQDVPCAVCRSNKPSTVMVPARNNCYAGWTMEYSGYLMAGRHALQATNHICMDENPEFLQHGSKNDNQHILYLVEGRCGSLPCPPYVEGRELTCVVCSK